MGARGPKPGQKVGGRVKGTPNKIPTALKEMILTSLSEVGGVEYLKGQATENPGPYLALIGKVLPQTVNQHIEAKVETIKRVIVDNADG